MPRLRSGTGSEMPGFIRWAPVDAPGTLERDSVAVDARRVLVREWLSEVLGSGPRPTIADASADASFRRYFRVRTGETTCIVMDDPQGQCSLNAWLDVRARLAGAGLTVPTVHAADPGQGLLLVSDLGTRHYLDEVSPARADALYADALAALATMQSAVSCEGLPAYDAPFLERELQLFETWFLGRHLEVRMTSARRASLRSCFDGLIAACLEQEQVFVHRDYHSRNLMFCSSGNPGILDFQDAVRGPIAYDVASLFRDVYVSWPEDSVEKWIGEACEALRRKGLLRGTGPRRFARWADFCGVQRHLKIAGIFSRLHYRDAKSRYLEDIPVALGYLHAVSRRHSSLHAIAALIEDLELFARLEERNAAVAGPGHRENEP